MNEPLRASDFGPFNPELAAEMREDILNWAQSPSTWFHWFDTPQICDVILPLLALAEEQGLIPQATPGKNHPAMPVSEANKGEGGSSTADLPASSYGAMPSW